ncbi:MAG: thioredoxin family protein [Halobacteriovoraceae bacterium]|nr:thioredoxin family protein [Halobacteriovoraceae bacterium]
MRFIIFFISLFLSSGIFSFEWITENLDQVFKQNHEKPYFIYFGAKWCPPCNMMKNEIFSHSLFKKSIEQFSAIYIDGDREDSNIWSMKFNAKSYPTMIVLDKNLKEISRMPITNDINLYISMLEKAKNSSISIKELLELSKSKPLEMNEIERIIGHSWYQDEGISAKEDEMSEIFKNLSSQPKTTNEQKKYLLVFSLFFKTGDDSKTFSDTELKLFEKLFFEVDHPYFLSLLSYKLSKYVDSIKDTTKKDIQLNYISRKLLAKIQSDLVDSTTKISYFSSLIEIYSHLQKNQKKQIKDQFIAFQENLLKETQDQNKRHSIISEIMYNLVQLKEYDKAIKIGENEISASHSPYYIMSYLGLAYREKGDFENSLVWRRKAFETADNPSRKLKWGTYYFRELVKLKPKKASKIKELLSEVLVLTTQVKGIYLKSDESSSLKILKSSIGKLDNFNEIKQFAVIQAQKYCAKSDQLAECQNWINNLKKL